MLTSMAFCNGCGGVYISENVEEVETPEGTIIDNPDCTGFTRGDLQNEKFGASNAEQLARSLYKVFHNENEEGWPYLAREAT